MRVYKYFFFFTLLSLLMSCSKDDVSSDNSITETYLFKDGFETQNNSLAELFTENAKRWTKIQ